VAPADPPILHLDDDLVVVDKPAGLPAVPGRAPGLEDCVSRRLADRLGDIRVVHRLDMATSGVMVFARHATAQARLSQAFARRAVAKGYVAWVEGPPLGEDGRAGVGACGRIDLPLAADWPRRPRQRVCADTGKPSVTHWRCTAVDPVRGWARLDLAPQTGRTHQLRVHLAAIGHPIVGDALYGPQPPAAGRLMLHAASIGFDHPGTGAPVAFASAAPF
jgi:tRNA pseudouridine32 synthase/23S rRNA pseudouridine746 synthase